MSIAALDDVKNLVGVPLTDTSKDAALQLALDAANDRVLDLTRYVETDITGQQDVFRDVQMDQPLRVTKRPVAVVTAVEGRVYGNSEWSTMSWDILDGQEGDVVVLGWQSWWPPVLRVRPYSQRWRNIRWPLIRVTYDVTGIGGAVPGDLLGATAALAAYWWKRDLAGASASSQIGQLQETWLSEALPPWVRSRLSRHMKQGMALWV